MTKATPSRSRTKKSRMIGSGSGSAREASQGSSRPERTIEAHERREGDRRRPRAHEHDRPERCDERPDDHGAGVHEPAERPLEEHGQDEHQADLHDPEDVVPLGPRQEDEARDGRELVRERDGRRERATEREVGERPRGREDADARGDERQRTLAQPGVGVVARSEADRGQAFERPGRFGGRHRSARRGRTPDGAIRARCSCAGPRRRGCRSR